MDEHMHCKDMLQGLSDYIDDEASATICQEIERHLEDCDNCRIMLDTLRKTITLYQQIDSTDPLPDEIRDRLVRTLHLEDLLPVADSDHRAQKEHTRSGNHTHDQENETR